MQLKVDKEMKERLKQAKYALDEFNKGNPEPMWEFLRTKERAKEAYERSRRSAILEPMSDTLTAGFYNKFEVTRKDTGETMDWRETFTLIPSHDRHARVALAAYAASIEDENPGLATDLREHFGI